MSIRGYLINPISSSLRRCGTNENNFLFVSQTWVYEIASKPLLRFLLLPMVIFSLLSCGLKIGEEPANNKKVDLGGQLGCLSEFGQTTIAFLNAKLSNTEITELKECLQFSLTAFEKYVHGQEKDVYKPEEIQRFLQDNFFKDSDGTRRLVLTDSHLEQLTHLKALIIGGDPALVTKTELRAFIERLDNLEQAFLILNPVMPVINWPLRTLKLSQSTSELVQDTDKARQALSLAASLIADSISAEGASGYRYDLSRVGPFIAEFRDFIGWTPPKGSEQGSRTAIVWGEFVKQFYLLSQGGEAKVGRQEFKKLLKSFAKWYGWMTVLKIEVRDSSGSYFYGDRLRGLIRTVDLFFDLFSEVISGRRRSQIGFANLRRFVSAIGDMGFIPFGVRSSSASKVFEEFVKKVLGDYSVPPKRRSTSSLKLHHLKAIQSEYEGWKEVQQFISNRRGSPFLSSDFKAFGAENTVAFEEMSDLISSLRPLLPNDSHTVYLVEKEKMPKFFVTHDASDLSMMNIYRLLYRLAIRGFSDYNPELEMTYQGLTAEEFQGVYDGLRPIGLDTGLMDPRAVGSGARSFMEANLFTYRGNGYGDPSLEGRSLDRLVSFAEGVQFLMYLQSAAVGANGLYENLRLRVGESGKLDPGQCLPYLDRKKVRGLIADLLIEESDTMPGLQMYLRNLSRQDRQEYSKIMLKAAYHKETSEAAGAVDLVEKNEVTIAFAVVQYAETIFTKYNSNGDDLLSKEEVEKSYPRFKEFIRGMLVSMGQKKPSENMILGVFRYIISHGDIPDVNAGTFTKLLTWLGFQRRAIIWRIELTRMDILKIFSSVIAKSSEMAQQDSPKALSSEFPNCALTK